MAARKYSAILYVAIFIALAASYGVYKVIESARLGSAVATRRVVTAKAEIPLGAAIQEYALQVEEIPDPIVPDGAFADPALIVGRVARVDIFPGEVMVPGRLAPEGTIAGLEAKITPGKRAWGLRVDDVSGLAGMIQPNSRVDVLLTIGGAQARMFMPNMRVLAMGSEVQQNEEGEPINATVATLEVLPDEAERLAVAMAQGRIQLALRGYQDNDSVQTRGATSAEVIAALRGVQPAPNRPRTTPTRPAPRQVEETPPVVPETIRVPVAPQRPESSTISIFRGNQKTTTKFGRDSARRDSVRRDTIPR